uniref:RanBP2-type domain-containing protein n=3 Tax=Rhizophora mucronata TaxID=61149 RepID=A0A2P2JRC2_RHIMU
MGEGREGDWECSGCKNRNYAFRSFCNRCKQPRLLVDTKTPADSKWLPRIGDWICNGCTNNNYASREKCKKCGQPKEVAAMPAIAMPGVSLPTYSHYFARAPGGLEQRTNVGFAGNGYPQQPLPLTSSLSAGGADDYGVQSASTWPLGGSQISGLPYANPAIQPVLVPKGWRNGDWICTCGFHNYASRAQCKNCSAAVPPAIGTKRLASGDSAHDSENKRLNSGNTNWQPQPYPGADQMVGTTGNPIPGSYSSYPNLSSSVAPTWQVPVQFPQQVTTPALLGKGAKQWRNGDWMCMYCNNQNYASRSHCNRCKMPRNALAQAAS